ncbi:DNA helicase [Fusarium albosuccineum]|uniref:DNA helicase n=1 Tax=Fusarium albosuccineum TaxID=1237068 RepID=A0A8H4PES8_9HYPO|nr:DNA helicase [Fusarium albosuccineum]
MSAAYIYRRLVYIRSTPPDQPQGLRSWSNVRRARLQPTRHGDCLGSSALMPLFVHAKYSRCIVDRVTHSKRSPDQIKIALDFLCDFLKSKQVDPAKVLILSPYKAMVEAIERTLKWREYEALRDMRPPSTIDSIQGQEGDMVVVITGTTKTVGPGFNLDERRLNVMLGRYKSALVIFGDVQVCGAIYIRNNRARKSTPQGEVRLYKRKILRQVHQMLFEPGRPISLRSISPGVVVHDGDGLWMLRRAILENFSNLTAARFEACR